MLEVRDAETPGEQVVVRALPDGGRELHRLAGVQPPPNLHGLFPTGLAV